MSPLHVGDRVEKRNRCTDGEIPVIGTGVVKKVTFHRVTLEDGSEWRVRDGQAWGTGRRHYVQYIVKSE